VERRPAKDLVTGDIVMIKLGNVVPADMKLVDGDYLSIDQSALTGESLPVEKKKNDVAYSGSIVKMGQMNGLVTATGMNTLFGRAAQLTESVKTVSHFQKAVLKIGNFLILITLGLVAVILMVSLYRGDPFVRNPALLPDSDRRCYTGRLAGRSVRHDGRRRVRARQNEGYRLPPGLDRRDGRHGYSLLGQDRHAHQGRAQVGQPGCFQGEQTSRTWSWPRLWPRQRTAGMGSTMPSSKVSPISRR
jgi:hypothetical protein